MDEHSNVTKGCSDSEIWAFVQVLTLRDTPWLRLSIPIPVWGWGMGAMTLLIRPGLLELGACDRCFLRQGGPVGFGLRKVNASDICVG